MKINETTIREACNLLAETLIQKNHDYGNSVEEQFKEYGETSLLIRLDDKLRRLKQLQKASAKVKTETKQDTFFDLAGYSILDFILLSSEEDEPLSILDFTKGISPASLGKLEKQVYESTSVPSYVLGKPEEFCDNCSEPFLEEETRYRTIKHGTLCTTCYDISL